MHENHLLNEAFHNITYNNSSKAICSNYCMSKSKRMLKKKRRTDLPMSKLRVKPLRPVPNSRRTRRQIPSIPTANASPGRRNSPWDQHFHERFSTSGANSDMPKSTDTSLCKVNFFSMGVMMSTPRSLPLITRSSSMVAEWTVMVSIPQQ